jgi:hypothetical protein
VTFEWPKSPLPREPEYWEELTRRIEKDAAAPLLAYARAAEADGDWYRVLAGRAHWLVAASAAAMLFVWLVSLRAEASVAERVLERSFLPDEVAGTLVGGPEVPSVDTLMVQFPPAVGGERP